MASIVHGASAPVRAVGSARSGASLTYALLLLMVLIWGVNFSVVKFGTTLLEPMAFNGLRVALAAVVLVVLAVLARAPWPSRRDTVVLLGLGILGNGLYQVFFIEGIARTRAGNAALVLAATPAFIALIGRLRGVERVSRRGWMGIALQLVGMGMVVLGAAQGTLGVASPLGDTLILAGALCWAVFTVALKPYTHRVHAMQLSALTMVGGALPLLAFAAPTLVRASWAGVGLAGWGAILYSGLAALVVAYLIFYRGVRVIGPTRTAMFGNLQPLIAIVVAWLLLGEAPTGWQLAGAGSIMSGLLLNRP